MTLFFCFLLTWWASALPAVPRSLKPDFEAMVAAEKAFSVVSQEKGTRDAFYAFLAEESVLYRNGQFVPGKPFYEKAPRPEGILSWKPAFADIAGSGDFGYTTGPYEFRPKSLTDAPVGFGQYLTIWKKTAAGEWKALIDVGIHHPGSAAPGTEIVFPKTFPQKTTARSDTAALRNDLWTAETAFARHAREQGLRYAYEQVLPAQKESFRLLRNGKLPYTGAVATTLAAAGDNKVTYTPVRAVPASSGDLGFTYGFMEHNGRKGPFLRIWRNESGTGWKLSLELLNIDPV